MINGEDTNTHDSTEYFHLYAEEWENIDPGDALSEESAAGERASSEGRRRCPGLQDQAAEEMHVEAPPRVGYTSSDPIGLYPPPLDVIFHRIYYPAVLFPSVHIFVYSNAVFYFVAQDIWGTT